jgi:hypothetical protein
MTWIIVVAAVLGLLTLGQLRVWRTEKIRLRCVDMAITNRTLSNAYIQAEADDVIVNRAKAFEAYVRKGELEVKTE